MKGQRHERRDDDDDVDDGEFCFVTHKTQCTEARYPDHYDCVNKWNELQTPSLLPDTFVESHQYYRYLFTIPYEKGAITFYSSFSCFHASGM